MAVGKGIASRLRGRITIQRQNLVDNGRGGRKPAPGGPDWLDQAVDVPAEVIALRGDEALQNLVVRARQLWRVTIRPRSGIVPSLRVVWTDRFAGQIVGNIRSAALNDARDGLVMTVESEAKAAA